MLPSFERRQSKRYIMSLSIEFKVRKDGKFVAGGTGRIHDVSRTGLLFESGPQIPAATVLRLFVDWPVRFQGKTRVGWVVDGIVLRSSSSGTAVNIMRQWFERGVVSKKKTLAS